MRLQNPVWFDIRNLYNHSIRKYLETETLSNLSNLRVEIQTLFRNILEHAENMAVERACSFFVYHAMNTLEVRSRFTEKRVEFTVFIFKKMNSVVLPIV